MRSFHVIIREPKVDVNPKENFPLYREKRDAAMLELRRKLETWLKQHDLESQIFPDGAASMGLYQIATTEQVLTLMQAEVPAYIEHILTDMDAEIEFFGDDSERKVPTTAVAE